MALLHIPHIPRAFFPRAAAAAFLAVALGGPVLAAPPEPAPPIAPAPLPPLPAPLPSAEVTAPPRLTEAQLDELVAPIALYPDVVLASLLPATTAPLDVVAAARHVADKGGSVDAPPDDAAWEPGVVSMLQYPEVLAWMNDNLAWVEAMGVAVATQQEDVLAAVQRYREKAKAAGVLKSDDHLVVREEPAPTGLAAPAGTTIIVIVPADPQVVYVPVYDPWPVLEPGFVWAPARPYWSVWWDFRFGSPGPWAWNAIAWGWGPHHRIYAHSRPWYGSRYSHAYAAVGPDRPRPWTGRFQGRSDRPVRVTRPQAATAPTPTTAARSRTRTTNVSPTPRAARAPDTTSPRDRRVRTTTTPSPVTRPDARRTPAPRTDVPPVRVERRDPTPAPAPAPAPAVGPTPRLRTTPPAVIDRDTVDRFRRRGSGSVTPQPAPSVEPTPRRVDRTPPRGVRPEPTPERRATPAPQPTRSDDSAPRIRRNPSPGRDRAIPSGEDVRLRRDRGRKSLEPTDTLPE